MREILITGLLVLFITACSISSFACVPGAEFELGPLNVSPAQALEGNPVLVSVDVTNAGEAKGAFNAKLKIDKALTEMKFVSIAAGQTVKVSFIVDATATGTHDVELNGLAGTFSVLSPPGFADLVISPSRAVVGEKVTISADVSNSGKISGNYTVALTVNGLEEETRTVKVNADTTVTVAFGVAKDYPGNYSVTLGGLSGSFTMLKPAEFVINNLVVSPQRALPGREVSVSCNVANTGEVDSSYSVSLTIDGVQVDSKDVVLLAGTTQTVVFSLAYETRGTYNVAIGDLSGTLVIMEGLLPTLYVGDTWIFKEVYKGIAYTRTETITGQEGMEGVDCYVMKVTYNPPLDGWLSEETKWLEKATYRPVVSRISTTFLSSDLTVTSLVFYSREEIGTEWPYSVGNEFTVKTSWTKNDFVNGQPFTDKGNSTATYKCTAIEDVTIEAGTFRCFKIVEYEEGQAVSEYWYSDKAKTFLKTRGITDAHTLELLSYSVK